MPHLSPMNWMIMLMSSLLFISMIKSINWWNKPSTMMKPTLKLSKSSHSAKWNWYM